MEWIRTADNMPGEGEYVLIVMKSGGITIAHLTNGRWRGMTGRAYEDVPYWMPLPEVPGK